MNTSTPKHYESWEAADAAFEDRYATKIQPCKSLIGGTLVLENPANVIIPPDPPGAKKAREKGPTPLVMNGLYKTKIRSKHPNCNHNWYRHGRDRYKRQRFKCSVCGTVGVEMADSE